MEPVVRVELTTNGLQIRCSATELHRQSFLQRNTSLLKTKRELCEYSPGSQSSKMGFSATYVLK